MSVVYVAGPYRAKTYFGVLLNIFRAWRASKKLWDMGFAALCPHMNTFWMTEWPNSRKVEMYLEGDLEQLERCDAVFAVNGWDRSEGALGEIQFAQKRGIPMFECFEDIEQWGLRKDLGLPWH